MPTSGSHERFSPAVTFALCGAAAYITTLDLSIVNVAFPEILRDFKGVSRADLSWIVTVYNIAFGSLLVVAGKTADKVGRKRIFLIGVGVFALGSAICAFAPGLPVMIAGRAVQGLGGALLSPASLGLLLAAFPQEKRTQTVAAWGGIGALGVASGPSLGALLITLTDWRAAFWINLPICVAIVIAGRAVLRDTPKVVSANPPDYLGASLVTVALGALALGLSRSDAWGWSDPRTIGSLALAVLLVPVFIGRQRRHPEPVLDLALFQSRSFSVANAAGVCFYLGFAALGLNNVLFLRQVWGYTVLHAGLLSALAPATVALLAPFSGRLAARVGLRPFVIVGPLLVAAGVLLLATRFGQHPSPWWFALNGELIAIGIAGFIPINSAAVVTDLPPDRLSVGGAVNNTARQVGSVIGVAMLVALLGSPTTPGELLDGHRRGWLMIAAAGVAAAALGVWLPKRRQVAVSAAPPTNSGIADSSATH